LAKRKQQRATRVTAADKLKEPNWDGWEEWDGAQYHRFKQGTSAWYYHTFKPDELVKHTFEWMKQNGYSKEEIKCAKAVPSYVVGTTTSINCCMLLKGMPSYNKKEDDYWQTLPGTMGVMKPIEDWIKIQIAKAVEKGKSLVEEKTKEEKSKINVYQPTIQERLYHAAIRMTVEIDDVMESEVDLIDVENFTPLRWLKIHQCKGNHAKIIKTFYEPGYNELHELLNPPSAKEKVKLTEQQLDWRNQLDESFEVFTKEEIQSRYKAFKLIIDACDMLMSEAKLTRKPRKVKPKSAEKLVTKIKYKQSDEKLALVSINPVDIIKANELWVYNTKTRKLGYYITSSIDPLKQKRDGTGLEIKGTTLTRYDEKQSVCKTLRKPEEQLAEFKKCGKIQRKKFFENLKVTETKLNGRVNPETILLLTA
jgi:hypothetical protein